MSIYPGADPRPQWFGTGGPAVEPQVIVLHTTEGRTWPAYAGGSKAPHLTVMPVMDQARLDWRQHFSLDRSARALAHPSGTVETNNRGAIQVELIGTCSRTGPGLYWPSAPAWALRALAQFVAWAVSRFEQVELLAPAAWPAYPSSAGRSVARFTDEQWLAFRGICGHLHVPSNTHGDPGNFPIQRLIDLCRGDDMPLSKDDLDRISTSVWSAKFGRGDERESAGDRLDNVATQGDLLALEQRLLAAIEKASA
jgi:hypothetical protein